MRPDIAWSRSFPVPRTHCLPRRATPSCPTAMFDNARMLALVRRRGYIISTAISSRTCGWQSVPLSLLAYGKEVTPERLGPVVPGTVAFCLPMA